jgi:hypothetical protein
MKRDIFVNFVEVRMKKKKQNKTVVPVKKKAKPGRIKRNKVGHVRDPKTGKFLTGRPPVVTKAKLQKLEIAFGYGATDQEACAFAEISLSTLYNYQNENPDFLERKEGLKQMPNLQARKTVVEDLKDNPETGKWWLERRLPGEFGKAAGTTNVAVQVNNVINEKKKEYGF